MAAVPLPTLPDRRFISPDVQPPLDQLGFLLDSFVPSTSSITEILLCPAALVVSAPWTGKTFVANKLKLYFKTEEIQTAGSEFGRFFHATLFETPVGGLVTPPWWNQWQSSDRRALWVVDAIDEDVRQDRNRTYEIVEAIEALDPETRGRLTLLMFSRESEEPPAVRERLQALYPPSKSASSSELRVLRLAPLSASDARDVLGGAADTFGRVCEVIRQNHLQSIASLPAVLLALKDQPGDASLSTVDVWRKVLRNLLWDERIDATGSWSVPPIDDRFAATSRIAAVLTLSRHAEISTRVTNVFGPLVSDIIPDTTPKYGPLREAADVARRAAVFQQIATGYRFSQQHVQEWFTAFALEDVPQNRLRPVVLDEQEKPLPHCIGTLGILHQVTRHPEVRDWIVELFDGVPPPPDSAPFTLRQSVAILDRLQEAARETRFGLALWHERGLENLAAQGLGSELARRLDDCGLSLGERRLMIEVAHAVHATEVAAVAKRIAADDSEPVQLRTSAAILLREIGTDNHFRQLEAVATAAEPSTREERELVSALVAEFLERGLWSFSRAASHAPTPSPDVADMTVMLQHKLKESMTVGDARELLRDVDWGRIPTDVGRAFVRQSRGPHSLLIHAVETISRQDNLSAGDYELLQPIVLKRRDLLDGVPAFRRIVGLFVKDMAARRELFRAGLEYDPTGRSDSRWRWRWVLTGEDAEWLEDLIRQESQPNGWLLEHLLSLAYYDGVPVRVRRRIRSYVRERNADVVTKFGARWRSARAQQRRFQQEEQQRQREQAAKRIQLEDAVRDILRHPKLKLDHKMWQLARVCFTDEHTRPWNLSGEWQGLEPRLQQSVLALCEEAFGKCKPTPIPAENAYPAAIIYESCAFREILRSSTTYILDGEQIRRWLPATLIFSIPDYDAILKQCMEADCTATEDVLLGEIRRCIRSDELSVHVAANLPAEYWSDRLVKGGLELVKDNSLSIKGRCELLRVLSHQAPEPAAAVASDWLAAKGGAREVRWAKRTTAIDVLLGIDPEKALRELAKEVAKRGRDVLVEMQTLRSYPARPAGRLAAWPATALEQLTDILQCHFPSDSDPPQEGAGFVTPEDELRDLRRQIPAFMFNRGTSEDEATLGRLAQRHKEVRTWLQHAIANREASRVLRRTPLPVEKVVRLLDDALYRLIRHSGDLQRAVLDELARIGKTAKEHLSMLYERPGGRAADRGKADSRRKRERRHLAEDALQAYLLCRLNDLLPGRVLEPEATTYFINRETLGTKNQKLDLKVEAPTLTGKKATVVIEVKWIDNRQVGSALKEQLGEQYLVGANLTHGIYLVGWAGTERRGMTALGIRSPHRHSTDKWLAAFRRQADEFAQQYPDIKIEPIVMDLDWDV